MRIIPVLIVASGLTASFFAHPMTYKGTVVAVTQTTLQVRAVDDMSKKEATHTFKITAKTKVLRGDKVVTFADAKVKKDERIAVTTDMDATPDEAVVVRLAAASDRVAPAAPAVQTKTGPITVTGCVAAGAKAGQYVLNNGTLAGDATAKSYSLSGGQLKAHVGHKVAVTGTLKAAAMPKDHKMSKEAMAAMPGVLQVKTVKMVAATCA